MLTVSILIAATFLTGLWALGIVLWARSGRTRNPVLPTVSVIVAARNEAEFIGPCVDSLLRLDYPADRLQIRIVDDHSTDATRTLAEQHAAGRIRDIAVLAAPPCPAGIGPKKFVLQHGIQNSTGEILLFTDADCVVPSGWARAVVACYDERTGAVVSAVLPPRRANLPHRLYRLERLLVSYTSASAIGLGFPASVNGGSFSYRRKVYEEIGGIALAHVASGDDDLMAQAIARHGWKVQFAAVPESVVEDQRPPVLNRHLHATIRHQSTLKYYPRRWRAIYAATILSSLLLFALLIAGLWLPQIFPWVLAALGVRVALEGTTLALYCRRLHHRVTVGEFALAELCLPLYLLIRPLLAWIPAYRWHERAHTAAVPSTRPLP